MNAFLYWTGFGFWIAVAVFIIGLTSEFSRKPGKWAIVQILGFGIGIVRHDGNEEMVERLLRCGYRIRRVSGYWIGSWHPLKWFR